MALTGIGLVALARYHPEDARTALEESVAIYQRVYAGKHYRIGAALVNLAAAQSALQNMATAEHLLRDGLQMYTDTLPADHQSTAIAKVKLAHLLVEQHRYAEAEPLLASAREALEKQSAPPAEWLRASAEDLAHVYDAFNRPEKATEVRSVLAGLPPEPPRPAAK